MFDVGLSKREWFTNMKLIVALTRAFSMVVQFCIGVLEVPDWVLGIPNFQTFNERCWRYFMKLWPSCLHLSARAFGLVAWFSLRVREVPSSILGMPHITNMDERWVIVDCQNVIGYNIAADLNSRTTPLKLHHLVLLCQNVTNLQIWKWL